MLECRKREPAALCCALLALLTLAVYLPVMEARFVTFDDSAYLTDNATVQAGLTWEGLRWAFTGIHSANSVSAELALAHAGLPALSADPWGHHLANLLLHTANTLMLFGLLRQLTGTFWRSAFVAALVCAAPAARRIRGVGGGAEGRAQHLLLSAVAVGIRKLRGQGGSR